MAGKPGAAGRQPGEGAACVGIVRRPRAGMEASTTPALAQAAAWPGNQDDLLAYIPQPHSGVELSSLLHREQSFVLSSSEARREPGAADGAAAARRSFLVDWLNEVRDNLTFYLFQSWVHP